MRDPKRLGGRVLCGAMIIVTLGALGAGCLTAPVVAVRPEVKGITEKPLKQTAVDKVDLLFAIDSSGSMGDKQALLSEAIPDLLQRLLTPDCVDTLDATKHYGPSVDGACAQGELEFMPIKDLHVGIVSSALGPLGGSACAEQSDRGQLVNRTKPDNAPLAAAAPLGFLTFKPGGDARKPATTEEIKALTASFQQLVEGVGEKGCAFEAQMESWYRFLIQPDPYERVVLEGEDAKLVDVDDRILKQRKAFLRPDSLVAIIQVTDEDESTVDPLALGGRGYIFAQEGSRKGATTACATDVNGPDCGSCYETRYRARPECAAAPRPEDEPNYHENLRFFEMKRRFGLDPRFPLSRYVNGLGRDEQGSPLAQLTVPNRDGEHRDRSGYLGERNCVNPLFATELPGGKDEELCNLKADKAKQRSPDLVFFATITGVPHQLLHFDARDTAKSKLTPADWTNILGKDGAHSDFTGADPHMIVSVQKRKGLSDQGVDPIHGREWDTRLGPQGAHFDLQYACIFPLKAPRKCQNGTDIGPKCDCDTTPDSPLCDPGDRSAQRRAKAYPGIRQLTVAKAVGDQGIVSSICPSNTDDPSRDDYGYRPAVRAIVDRFIVALKPQCLDRPLTVDAAGVAPCMVVEVLPNEGDDSACDDRSLGLSRLAADERRRFVDANKGRIGNLEERPICKVDPLVVENGASCKSDARPGWCYVTGDSARAATENRCQNAVLFSRAGAPPKGSDIQLACITTATDDG